MEWIREHKLFSGTFAIVVVLIAIIIISYLVGGGGRFLFSGIQDGLSGIEKPFSTASQKVGDTTSGFFAYKQVQRENERLKNEIMRLSEENAEFKLTRSELNELRQLSNSFNFKPYEGRPDAQAAAIVSLDSSRPYNSFTIDVGSDQGIKKGAVVVDGNGLVGLVQSSSKDTSKVKSILEDGVNISFQVERKPEILGVVKGTGDRQLSGYLLDETARIIEGDQLLTSHIGRFPEGLPVGKVVSVEYDSNSKLKRIKVKTSARFQVMRKVAVFK